MRSSQMRKIPYTLVIGDHERDDKTVTYRRFGAQDQITVSVDEFLKLINKEIKDKVYFTTEKKELTNYQIASYENRRLFCFLLFTRTYI